MNFTMAKKTAAYMKTTGRYLGLTRHANRTIKAKAKKIRATKGIRAAISFLKKSRKK